MYSHSIQTHQCLWMSLRGLCQPVSPPTRERHQDIMQLIQQLEDISPDPLVLPTMGTPRNIQGCPWSDLEPPSPTLSPVMTLKITNSMRRDESPMSVDSSSLNSTNRRLWEMMDPMETIPSTCEVAIRLGIPTVRRPQQLPQQEQTQASQPTPQPVQEPLHTPGQIQLPASPLSTQTPASPPITPATHHTILMPRLIVTVALLLEKKAVHSLTSRMFGSLVTIPLLLADKILNSSKFFLISVSKHLQRRIALLDASRY